QAIASSRRLRAAIMEVTDTTIGVPAFLASILASVRSEMADSSNRHKKLWLDEYASSEVHIHHVEEDLITPYGKYDRGWLSRYINAPWTWVLLLCTKRFLSQ